MSSEYSKITKRSSSRNGDNAGAFNKRNRRSDGGTTLTTDSGEQRDAGCITGMKAKHLLQVHGLDAASDCKCDFSNTTKHNFYLSLLLQMIDDWISPEKCYANLCEVATLQRCSKITAVLGAQRHLPCATESNKLSNAKAAVKEVMCHISQQRTHLSSYTKDFFESVGSSQTIEVVSYIVKNIPLIIEMLWYDMMMAATESGRDDVLKCLLHMLSNVMSVYFSIVDLLSLISEQLNDTDLENLFNDLSKLIAKSKSTTEILLTAAVRCGNVELVKALIDYPLDGPNQLDLCKIRDGKSNDTLLHIALRCGELPFEFLVGDNVEQLKLYFLLRDKPIKGCCEQFALAACYLSFMETPAWLQELISTEVCFHNPMLFRIHLARNVLSRDFTSVTEVLVQNGCDINAPNAFGETPLHVVGSTNVVAYEMILKMVDTLGESGASMAFAKAIPVIDVTQQVCPIVIIKNVYYAIDCRLFHKIFVRMLTRFIDDDDDVNDDGECVNDDEDDDDDQHEATGCVSDDDDENFSKLSSDSVTYDDDGECVNDDEDDDDDDDEHDATGCISDDDDDKFSKHSSDSVYKCTNITETNTSLRLMRLLIEHGADTTIRNSAGLTASEVSLRHSVEWYKMFRYPYIDKDRILFAVVDKCWPGTHLSENPTAHGDTLFQTMIKADTFTKFRSALLGDLCSERTNRHRDIERQLITSCLFYELRDSNQIADNWLCSLTTLERAVIFGLLSKAHEDELAIRCLSAWSSEKPTVYLPEFITLTLPLCSHSDLLFKFGTISIDATNELGETALHLASKSADMHLVEVLLDLDADISKLNNAGLSPLAVALRQLSAEDVALKIVSKCIERGDQSLNGNQLNIHCNILEQTILHISASRDDSATTEYLIRCGADVKSLDANGRSPLFLAIASNSWKAARVLLDSSPDAIKSSRLDVAISSFGETLFHKMKHDRIPSDILAKLTDSETGLLASGDFHGDTPLHCDLGWAVTTGDYRCVNAQNAMGETPLHKAFERDNIEYVHEVIEHGADMTLTDAMFNTPLHGSKITSSAVSSVFDILQKLDYNVEEPNIFGELSALHWLKNSPMLKEYTDFIGNTKLHIAAGVYGYCGLDDNKKFFVEAADDDQYSKWNMFGRTPIHIHWLASGFKTLLTTDTLHNVIKVKDGRARTIWHHIFLFEGFLHFQYDINGTAKYKIYDSNKKVIATDSHHVIVEKIRLNKHFYGLGDIDDRGRTPLHYAARTSDSCDKCHHDGCLLYCKCCLNFFGVDLLQVKDKFGRTPIYYAYMSGFTPTEDSRRLIPNELLDPDQIDIFGYTAKQMFDSRLDTEDKPKDPSLSRLMKHISDICEQPFPPEHTTDFLATEISSNEQMVVDAWDLWTADMQNGLYSDYQRALSSEVYRVTTAFVRKIVDAVATEDPRLRGNLLQVGSSFEETRIESSYEFDFNVELDLSKVCEVLSENETLPGFATLRKHHDVDPSTFAQYEYFFDERGNCKPTKINFAFQATMVKVLSGKEFWEDEEMFDIANYEHFYELTPNKRCKHLAVKLNQLILGKYIYSDIAIDIVPVIHIPNWWPANGRLVDDDIRHEGCNFIFDQPYRKYRLPYSPTQYVKLSFARAESLLLKRSPAVLRAGYMVAKRIWMHCNQPAVTSHVLKMAALWSFSDQSESCRRRQEFTQSELQSTVTGLLQRLYQFSVQDYVPCYFMPSFHFLTWKFESILMYSRAFLKSIAMDYEKLFRVSTKNSEFMMEYDDVKRSLVFTYLVLYASSACCGSSDERVMWIWPQLQL